MNRSNQKPHEQYHYVFAIQKDEAELFDILKGSLVQVSKEEIRLSDDNKPPQIINLTNLHPEYMRHGLIPSVSIFLNQQNGQINVCLSPIVASLELPRSPATDRINSNVHQIDQILDQSKSILEKLVKDEQATDDQWDDQRTTDNHSTVVPQLPTPESRQVIPSPAGVAVRTPEGSQFLPLGSMRSPHGTIWTPKGSMYSPGGTFFWPTNTLVGEDGSAVTPAGTYYGPDKVGHGLAGHIYTPNGSQVSPNGSVVAPWDQYVSYAKKPSHSVVRSIRQPKKSHSVVPVSSPAKRLGSNKRVGNVQSFDSQVLPMRISPTIPPSNNSRP